MLFYNKKKQKNFTKLKKLITFFILPTTQHGLEMRKKKKKKREWGKMSQLIYIKKKNEHT